MELIAPANGIEIAYEAFGDPADPTVLLVMGLGVQMLGWDAEFCELLAGRGFRVVRFDNRDVGRSTKIEGGPRPDVMAAAMGDASSASYTLDEMADDCAGLLDHLGVEAAHLVGASQGGMIAQTLAIRHPERVLSLVSIMSTHRGSGGRAAASGGAAGAADEAAGGSGGVRGVRGGGVAGDRLAGVRRRRGGAQGAGAGELRSGLSTRRARRGSWWRSSPRAIGPRRCGGWTCRRW